MKIQPDCIASHFDRYWSILLTLRWYIVDNIYILRYIGRHIIHDLQGIPVGCRYWGRTRGALLRPTFYSYEKFLLSTENCAEITLFDLNYYLVVLNMALRVLFLFL